DPHRRRQVELFPAGRYEAGTRVCGVLHGGLRVVATLICVFQCGRPATVLAIGAVTLAMAFPAAAQEVGLRPGGATAALAPAIVSPVVTDGRVTFRLR